MRARDVRPLLHLPSIGSIFSTVYGGGVGQSRPQPEPEPAPVTKRKRVLTDAFETDLTGPEGKTGRGEDIIDLTGDTPQEFVDLTNLQPPPLSLNRAVQFSHINPDETHRQLNFDDPMRSANSNPFDGSSYIADKVNELSQTVGSDCGFFDVFDDHAEHFLNPPQNRRKEDSAKYDNKSLHLLEYQGVPVSVAQVEHFENGKAEINYLCANLETHFGGGEAMVKHIADMLKDNGEEYDGNYLLNLKALPTATPSYTRMGLKFMNKKPREEGLPEMYTDQDSPLKSDPADKIPVGKYTKKQLEAKEKKQEKADQEEDDYISGRTDTLKRPFGVYTRVNGRDVLKVSDFGMPEVAPDSGYPDNGYRDKNGVRIHGQGLSPQDLPTEIQDLIGSFTGKIPVAVRDRVIPDAFRHPSTALPDVPIMEPEGEQLNQKFFRRFKPGLVYSSRKSFAQEKEGIPQTSKRGPAGGVTKVVDGVEYFFPDDITGGSTYKQRAARRFENFMHHKVVSKKQAKKYL